MHLNIAVRTGCRVRHRDWPPYHYAQLCPTPNGELRLCRIGPHDDKPPVEVDEESFDDDQNWKILDLHPE